jgi:DNA-binding MarR family transcriptional regulator
VVTRAPAQAAAADADEYACAQAWAALGAAHARVAGELASALARDCGLAVTEFEILLRLDQEPGRGLRVGELTMTVTLTQPALSRAVSRMAGRGLVQRAGAPDDGRGVLVMLTRAGQALLRQAVPVHAQVIRTALLDRLTRAEQEHLVAVLGRIAGQ